MVERHSLGDTFFVAGALLTCCVCASFSAGHKFSHAVMTMRGFPPPGKLSMPMPAAIWLRQRTQHKLWLRGGWDDDDVDFDAAEADFEAAMNAASAAPAPAQGKPASAPEDQTRGQSAFEPVEGAAEEEYDLEAAMKAAGSSTLPSLSTAVGCQQDDVSSDVEEIADDDVGDAEEEDDDAEHNQNDDFDLAYMEAAEAHLAAAKGAIDAKRDAASTNSASTSATGGRKRPLQMEPTESVEPDESADSNVLPRATDPPLAAGGYGESKHATGGGGRPRSILNEALGISSTLDDDDSNEGAPKPVPPDDLPGEAQFPVGSEEDVPSSFLATLEAADLVAAPNAHLLGDDVEGACAARTKKAGENDSRWVP